MTSKQSIQSNDNSIKIAFGSCNRQKLPQTYWKHISYKQPEYYIWLGDAVYTKNSSLIALDKASYVSVRASSKASPLSSVFI